MMINQTNEIKWEIVELNQRLKNDWGLFWVTGKDKQGNRYDGSTQTFINDPIIEDVYDIEKINNEKEKTI